MSAAIDECDYILPRRSDAAQKLVNLLLSKNPLTRLRSLINMKKQAFFHKLDFDDIEQKKVKNQEKY